MKKVVSLFSAFLFIITLAGCAKPPIKDNGDDYRKPDKFNFRFHGSDAEIDNPENDRRSYYKIFIDKAEEGRTTTGLESQGKTYEASLSSNRHLIMVEKWVLDQKTSRYIKLNNIEQPKPNFFYFDLPENRIVNVEMKTLKDGQTEFKADLERK
jgi:hypothetical protein